MRKEFQVLLIAMSGVRIKDSELLKLGMTLPGFIERSQTIAKLPSLSLLTLAAYSPSNWHCTYLDVDELGEFPVDDPQAIRNPRPDFAELPASRAHIQPANANNMSAFGQVGEVTISIT